MTIDAAEECWAERRHEVEWPTWLALAGCYGVWIGGLLAFQYVGWLVLVPLAVATAFHSSLQHEALHGHPTRSAALNEILVFLPLGLVVPYRRFRVLHLRHHNDERLTDPYDDPESFYCAHNRWRDLKTPLRLILFANATFAGRMVLGPALAMLAFWRSDANKIRRGSHGIGTAWLLHLCGLVAVACILAAAGFPVVLYLFGVAYPAMSLIMVRSYIEHKAAQTPAERSVIVEAHWFWRLLFLNNNLHSVHHNHPTVPWYRIPGIWQHERSAVLERNGGYLYAGYSAVAKRWLFRAREPVVHPYFAQRRAGESVH